MDEMMQISLQESPVMAADNSGAPNADSSNRETFGEIKRRFEEAAAINSTVPVVGTLARTNSVSIGSLGLGANSPGMTTTGSSQIVSPSWSKAEKRPSVGIMQTQSVTRSMSMAAGRGRGPLVKNCHQNLRCFPPYCNHYTYINSFIGRFRRHSVLVQTAEKQAHPCAWKTLRKSSKSLSPWQNPRKW